MPPPKSHYSGVSKYANGWRAEGRLRLISGSKTMTKFNFGTFESEAEAAFAVAIASRYLKNKYNLNLQSKGKKISEAEYKAYFENINMRHVLETVYKSLSNKINTDLHKTGASAKKPLAKTDSKLFFSYNTDVDSQTDASTVSSATASPSTTPANFIKIDGVKMLPVNERELDVVVECNGNRYPVGRFDNAEIATKISMAVYARMINGSKGREDVPPENFNTVVTIYCNSILPALIATDQSYNAFLPPDNSKLTTAALVVPSDEDGTEMAIEAEALTTKESILDDFDSVSPNFDLYWIQEALKPQQVPRYQR